jgi:hypothetical protein
MGKIKKFIKKNYLILILFITSTIFFLYQHYGFVYWDFSAYILNARYIFYTGTYFEAYRAPMASIIFGPLLLFGNLSKYLYLIIVSTLFFYGNIKLTNSIFKKHFQKHPSNEIFIKFVFYFFMLSPFLLRYGTIAGTELLGLAFLELFLSQVFSGKISGFYLGLATLTRYNFLIFIPFLLFNKNIKKIIINIISFVVILSPWLIYNKIKFNNFFTSIIDSYALNVHFREYLIEPFNFLAIGNLTGIFLPFMTLGIILSIIQIIKTKNIYKNKISLSFLLISFLIIYDCYNIPLKITRYLFNLILPIAFFSTMGLLFLKYKLKINKNVIIIILLIVFLITIAGFFRNSYLERGATYKFNSAAKDIQKLNINQCEILSPHWVPVTFFTENIYPLGGNSINPSIQQGKIILLFKDDSTIDDGFSQSEIKKENIIHETKKYLFLGKENISNENCSPRYIYDSPLIENPCIIIEEKFEEFKLGKLARNTCEIINN